MCDTPTHGPMYTPTPLYNLPQAKAWLEIKIFLGYSGVTNRWKAQNKNINRSFNLDAIA